MITYGSVCSGIEAASVAWHPLGWRAAFFSEIEAFPSAVLAARFGSNMPGRPFSGNGIPNHGDFTKIGLDGGPAAGPVDLLVGGTPCQSFSVAGKRLGLDDPRGNLALEYLALARRLGARWFVWENVPGVLSSRSGDGGAGSCRPGDGGHADGEDGDGLTQRDFATFLSFVLECGFGFAYRVLDAQHVRTRSHPFAVPQRRRRVFVVGHIGDWRPAAAVLLDPEGMRGNPAARRQTGQAVAGALDAGLGSRGQPEADRAHLISERDVAGTVSSKWAKGAGGPAGDEAQNIVAFSAKDHGGDAMVNVAPTLRSGGHDKSHANAGVMPAVAHALRAEGFDASEDGTGRGTPLVPVAFDMRGREGGAMPEGPHDTANIRAASGGSSRSYVAQPFNITPSNSNKDYNARPAQYAQALTANGDAPSARGGDVVVDWAVRRLTPRECERLQGFPDDWTLIPWRGKAAGACPDGPRYRALGNSMAVNVMRLIGERIDLFERLRAEGRIR